MKEATTVTRAQGLLQKYLRAVIKDIYNNEIPEPMLTIQSTPKAHGHITVGKVWTNGIEESYELNIGAETLARPVENTIATLIHECAHLYAMEKGIKDTSNNGIYHNKRFKEIAERGGYITVDKSEYMPNIGYSITEPTEKLVNWICERGFEDIKVSRRTRGIYPSDTTNKGRISTGTNVGNGTSSTRKYICPKCNTSVRATKDVFIICGMCQQRMELAKPRN